MGSIELGHLELQIEHLLQVVADLRAENKDLRHQLARHAREKNHWYQNNHQTAGKIKKIIGHLQEALV